MPIDDLLSANRAFLRTFRGPIPDSPAKKHLAIVTCMDNRLVGVLPPALGLGTGDAMFVRVAGARIGPGDRTAIRSVAVSILFAGVREVLVVGHTDCRTAASPERAAAAMREVGLDPDAVRAGRPLADALGLIESPEQAVRDAVEALRQSPLIPPWVEIAGAVFDLRTAEVHEITRSPAMGSAPETAAQTEVGATAVGQTSVCPAAPAEVGAAAGAYAPGPLQAIGAASPMASSGPLPGRAAPTEVGATIGSAASRGPAPVGPVASIGASGSSLSSPLPEIGGTPSSPLFSQEGASTRAGFADAATSLGVTASLTSNMGVINVGSAATAQRPAMAPLPPSTKRPQEQVGPTGRWTPGAPPSKTKPQSPPAERIRNMVEAASRKLSGSAPPPSDEEIPTAELLEDPAPGGGGAGAQPSSPPPAGPSEADATAEPKPIFTFDKDELRRRRDEKIRRIIKGF